MILFPQPRFLQQSEGIYAPDALPEYSDLVSFSIIFKPALPEFPLSAARYLIARNITSPSAQTA